MPSITLPYKYTPRWYQQPSWDAVMMADFQRGVFVWPRRNGKDLQCLNLLVCKAVQRVGLYFYMAPFYNQVRQIIWEGSDGSGRRFLDYIPEDLVESKTKLDMRIRLKNESQIKLCGSDNIDSIVGTNPVGIIFTEFSLHKPEAWHYLRPILAENGGWALFNGTPRGLNHFYQLFKQVENNKNWFVQYITRDETGIPTKEAIEDDRESGMPESLIQQEYYCSWTSSSEETLIPLDVIEPCIDKIINLDVIEANPRVMGVDVAFAEKGDYATIARRQGPWLHTLEAHQGMHNMAFAARVAHWINEWKPACVFIDAGRGEGVISRLIQLGYGHLVIPIHFGGKTFSDLYNKKKDEMWCKCKLWFSEPGRSVPNDQKLIEELSAPTFCINDKGFIEVESKKAMRRRGVASTDRADAVVLTFAEDFGGPVLTPKMQQIGVTQEMLDAVHGLDNGTKDYNPLDYMDDYLSSNQSWL